MLTLRERLRLEPSASRGAGVPHKKSSSGVGPSPSKLLPTLLLELLLYWGISSHVGNRQSCVARPGSTFVDTRSARSGARSGSRNSARSGARKLPEMVPEWHSGISTAADDDDDAGAAAAGARYAATAAADGGAAAAAGGGRKSARPTSTGLPSGRLTCLPVEVGLAMHLSGRGPAGIVGRKHGMPSDDADSLERSPCDATGRSMVRELEDTEPSARERERAARRWNAWGSTSMLALSHTGLASAVNVFPNQKRLLRNVDAKLASR
mmetsp:Transcript_60705/g.198733  ORF Transcript_60705/g.198733 Transcript_60705/m.198733 type:complete len:266 (+) Transcript_60705:407-1204(+)